MNIESVSPDVLVAIADQVMTITMNRPHVRNAMTPSMATAIGEALDRADGDETVRAVVVTGAGTAFCSGGDLRLVEQGSSIHSATHPEWGFGGMRHHFVATPIVAAVNGAAIGGGFEMCLASDLVVASERAFFRLPEVISGVGSNAGGAARLGRQLPLKIALEMVLTGRSVDAMTAQRLGLVNRVVEHHDVLDAAVSLALEIAGLPPDAVRSAKRTAYGAAWDA